MIKHTLIFLLSYLFIGGSVHAVDLTPEQHAGYKRLSLNDQQSFRAYVAGPPDARQGLLLLHGWRGLNREMEIWANQYAVQGYRVMAIDLYNSQIANNPKVARKLMNSLNQQEANNKFRAAIKQLSKNGRKVAVIGRSFGANQAIQAASVNDKAISAVVLFYPFGDVVKSDQPLTFNHAPVLGNFADKDFFFDKDRKEKFISAAKNQGIKLTIKNYSARHGFSNIFGNNFDNKADLRSFKNTLSFLSQHLH